MALCRLVVDYELFFCLLSAGEIRIQQQTKKSAMAGTTAETGQN
jgi:hypothetical protein